MEKLKGNPLKRRNRKSDKPVQSKKKKCEGSACSTFFSDLTRKFKMKKKCKEDTNSIVKSIIDIITETLPINVSQLQGNCTEMNILKNLEDDAKPTVEDIVPRPLAKIISKEMTDNKMTNKLAPLVSPMEMKNNSLKIDVKNIQTSKMLTEIGLPGHALPEIEPTNAKLTTRESDIASELTKHVATLRKISLITDEFNKKTAKNLKEIVDSVSEDLVKKLEEVKAEQAQSPTAEKKIPINLRIE